MPGVTEALALEKIMTLAESEGDQLAQKIKKMMIRLRPQQLSFGPGWVVLYLYYFILCF